MMVVHGKLDEIVERGVNAIARLAQMRGTLDNTQTVVTWMNDALNALRVSRYSIVKDLVWDRDEATTPFGKYRLYRTDDGYGLSFNYEELVHVGFNSVGALESPRDKAASYANPHYRAAILSVLEVK